MFTAQDLQTSGLQNGIEFAVVYENAIMKAFMPFFSGKKPVCDR